MMMGGYGLGYPYGSRTTDPYGDFVSKCLLVVGVSGAQPWGYTIEELIVCPTSCWTALFTLWPTPRPQVGSRAFPYSNYFGIRHREE